MRRLLLTAAACGMLMLSSPIARADDAVCTHPFAEAQAYVAKYRLTMLDLTGQQKAAVQASYNADQHVDAAFQHIYTISMPRGVLLLFVSDGCIHGTGAASAEAFAKLIGDGSDPSDPSDTY